MFLAVFTIFPRNQSGCWPQKAAPLEGCLSTLLLFRLSSGKLCALRLEFLNLLPYEISYPITCVFYVNF